MFIFFKCDQIKGLKVNLNMIEDFTLKILNQKRKNNKQNFFIHFIEIFKSFKPIYNKKVHFLKIRTTYIIFIV
jgi:hypothetical protein